jgi:AcrR family transcriptional regulator
MEHQRRETILAACERLLHRYGPSKTTMQDIAREARIAVGTVYLEFDSKETILLELSSRKHKLLLQTIERELAADRPFGERIRSAIDARTDAYFRIAEGGAHGSDLVHCSNAAVTKAHTAFMQAEHALFATTLREGARAGELEVSQPVVAARAMLVAYARFSPPWLFSAPREETRVLLRNVHEVVLFGLVKRKKR